MCMSQWVLRITKGEVKAKLALSVGKGMILHSSLAGGALYQPVPVATSTRRSESVRVVTRKIVDELCQRKMKPEETLVEVAGSDSNMQIDR